MFASANIIKAAITEAGNIVFDWFMVKASDF